MSAPHKKLLIGIILILFSTLPVVALADVTVTGLPDTFANLNDAISAASDAKLSGTITYNISGNVDLTATSKTAPDLALNGSASKVIINGSSGAQLTLKGIYCGKIVAANAHLEMNNIKLIDSRKAAGEGRDPDPWEFCYLEFHCSSASFTGCTFAEGVLLGGHKTAHFENCTFKLEPQYYTETNSVAFDPAKDYSDDHYLLWLADNASVTVNNSLFENAGYGAVKSTWNKYATSTKLEITISNSIFKNIGADGEHLPFHLDGASSVVCDSNQFINVYTEAPGEYINLKTGSKEDICTFIPYVPTAPKAYSAPRTGDSRQLALWFTLAALGAAGMLVCGKKPGKAH